MIQWPYKGMTLERYTQCEREGLKLTEEELASGWYYCWCEWDGMLIHKDWEEAKVCSCKAKENK